jgi:hypothetical protein
MLHQNPIFIRFCRANLRVKKAVFWYLLTVIVCAFTLAMIYVPQVVRDRDPMDAARAALLPLLIIQGIILLFMGTGSVATGITREKVDNVLNYQRLTPLPVYQKIMGYLFGLPVREYVLFAITLPFMAFVLIVGKVPPGAFLPYYLILFTSTLLYHFTGMVAGMISKKWRWSARISQGLIILLYFALPQLSHIGLVFMEFLTVRPVFAETILPVIGASAHVNMNEFGILAGQDVPFFTFMISGTLFSFIIQSLLIVLFAGIVARKWKADSVPAISKPMALATFAVFAVMSLANIWPNLTRSENALNIFQSNGDLSQTVAISALPLILGLVSTFLAFVLMTSALPDPMEFRQGRIRAGRHNRSALPPWEDDASGYLFTGLLFLIQAALLAIAFVTLRSAGYFDGINSSPFFGGFLLLTTGLALFYFQGLKENFGSGQLGLFVLLHWMLPILIAVLIFSINNAYGSTALLVAAASPLTLIPLSATMLLPPEQFDDHLVHIHRSLGFGLLVMTSLAIALHVWLYRKRKAAEAAA